ncbi:transposase [Paucisalibacillus globulus]|uniref:transposase n=1 Tax=Paucisalibacillus globulus TaxID=351095 RepID=UPI000BB6F7DF|nr:transposase [Paucisalibacillus globulus]
MAKNKGERRGKYYTHVEPRLIEIEGWARDGLIDEQIAKNLGVAYSTFRKYRDEHSALSAALKKGKEVVDRQVENAMLKTAMGYAYDETTYVSVEMSQEEYDLIVDVELQKFDKENPNATEDERDLFIMQIPKTKQVIEKVVTKMVKPDTTAQIFWLKNRRPDKWRDKQDIEAKVNHTHNPYQELTVEELKRLAEAGE